MLEAVGFPVAVNPETRLAAIARKRGWLVEQWAKAPGGPRPLLPIGPLLSDARSDGPARGPDDERGPERCRGRPMKALRIERSLARFAAARVAGSLRSGRGRHVRPARPRRRRPAGPARDRTGCACDRAWPASAEATCPPSTARPAATSSPSSASRSRPATRWWPTPTTAAASCWSRCSAASPAASSRRAWPAPAATSATASGWPSATSRRACRPGYCCDTGGGWSTHMVAHPSQLHPVPDDMSDDAAVMVEPTACAVHAALRHPITRGRHRGRARRRHPRVC